MYPKNCKQPIKEDYLLTGPLEPTNDAYAIAKIAASKCAKVITSNITQILNVSCQQIHLVRMIIMMK